MFSVEKCRKIDPEGLQNLSDKEVEILRDDMYELADLAFEYWLEEKIGSKNLKKVLSRLKHDI